MSRKGRRTDQRTLALEKRIKAADFTGASVLAREILATSPTNAFALKALAVGLMHEGRYGEAENLLQRVIRLAPGDAELYVNLGICLFEIGQVESAIAEFHIAARLTPKDALPQVSLCQAYSKLGRFDDAIISGQRAVELDAANPEAQWALGKSFAAKDQHINALPHLLAAVQHAQEDSVPALEQLASSLYVLDNHETAADIFAQLHEHYPGNSTTLCRLILCRLYLADWSQLEKLLGEFHALLNCPETVPADPAYLALPGLSPQQHKLLARTYAETILGGVNLRSLPPVVQGAGARPLRIGYLSADFNDHATSQLLVGVLEKHNRAAFRIFAYSSAIADASELRSRVEAAFDVFREIHGLSDEAAAQLIRRDEIDILVDLKGWTRGNRMKILAFRPAPVQMAWLGYPGTVGHEVFVDYLIGDAVVSPHEYQCDYSETLALLPRCYQPNDADKPLGQAPSREEAGLPKSGFVYCSFNQSYKFNPTLFDMWCRLLQSVPGSVLWIWRPATATACANLQREVLSRGVEADRLIFAEKLPLREHLGRLQLADLALDTFPVNSHTTGSDALWAGVPMVSLLGDTFAGRVGASLVTAVGLSEFVADNIEEYFQIAFGYAFDEPRQQLIRARLIQARKTSSLFDTEGFTRDLEELYQKIWRTHITGEKLVTP